MQIEAAEVALDPAAFATWALLSLSCIGYFACAVLLAQLLELVFQERDVVRRKECILRGGDPFRTLNGTRLLVDSDVSVTAPAARLDPADLHTILEYPSQLSAHVLRRLHELLQDSLLALLLGGSDLVARGDGRDAAVRAVRGQEGLGALDGDDLGLADRVAEPLWFIPQKKIRNDIHGRFTRSLNIDPRLPTFGVPQSDALQHQKPDVSPQ